MNCKRVTYLKKIWWQTCNFLKDLKASIAKWCAWIEMSLISKRFHNNVWRKTVCSLSQMVCHLEFPKKHPPWNLAGPFLPEERIQSQFRKQCKLSRRHQISSLIWVISFNSKFLIFINRTRCSISQDFNRSCFNYDKLLLIWTRIRSSI